MAYIYIFNIIIIVYYIIIQNRRTSEFTADELNRAITDIARDSLLSLDHNINTTNNSNSSFNANG